MQNQDDVRIVRKRDSATALLKKIGVPRDSYDSFISAQGDEFYVNISDARAQWGGAGDEAKQAAEQRLFSGQEPTPPPVDKILPPQPKVRTTSEVKTKPVKKRKRKLRQGIAARCLELMKRGQSNNEIWATIKVEFELPDNKSYYPAWYRSYFKRRHIILPNMTRSKDKP